jgi:predicted RNA binding protein YcfA (HicA-like mRNA interferase family)
MSSELPSLTPKQVVKVLEEMGYVLYRQKGSHRIYVKDERQAVVPYHGRDLKKGTLFQIIKSTGLSANEFMEYLR